LELDDSIYVIQLPESFCCHEIVRVATGLALGFPKIVYKENLPRQLQDWAERADRATPSLYFINKK
jgi:hypothetical protein